MRPIVWTRSSCVIGEKTAVAVARENDYYYYIVYSVRAEAKKNTRAHTASICTARRRPRKLFSDSYII